MMKLITEGRAFCPACRMVITDAAFSRGAVKRHNQQFHAVTLLGNRLAAIGRLRQALRNAPLSPLGGHR